MSHNYMTVTPRIRRRLNNEIFNAISIEVYGKNIGRLEREEKFNKVRSTIVHLLHHEHYPANTNLANSVAEIRDALNNLLRHPDAQKALSPDKIAKLQSHMDNLINTARTSVNPNFGEDDIQRFHQMCFKGREHFAEQNYDPNEFIAQEVALFASMIADNFDAYRETLNHQYL